MNDSQNQLDHALTELETLLADVPESAPPEWVTHCITRLFFWRVVSLRWQAATPARRQHLNTVLHLSETTLFDVALHAASHCDIVVSTSDKATHPILMQQAHHLADTLAALCQTQTDPASWHATLQPDQFRPAIAAAAASIMRMAQHMPRLWPTGDIDVASSVLQCMPDILNQSAPPAPRQSDDLTACLIELLQPQANQIVFDACCGSGNLLGQVAEHLTRVPGDMNTPEPRQALLIGQDKSPAAVALARLRLALLGWGYTRLETYPVKRGAVRQLPGLNLENGQALFADVVLAIHPQPFAFDWALHLLASLHPNRGRMALVVDAACLTGITGKRLLAYLLDHRLLQAIIELPAHCLPKHSSAPICLMIQHNPTPDSVAFISHRFHSLHAATGQTGLDWPDIRQAWQAMLAKQPQAHYLRFDGALLRQAHGRLDALPFGAVWDALRQQCAGIAEQEREQNRANPFPEKLVKRKAERCISATRVRGTGRLIN